MIRLQRISTSDEHYKFMEDLLVTSFPSEEYRPLSDLRRYTDEKNNFHNHVILDDDTPVGLITYWDFGSFYYFEHLATSSTVRNGGYGKKILAHLTNELQRPIVLEVELPTTELAERRIKFYERQGFTLWNNEYKQPPYKSGDGFLPMLLMVYGDLDSQQHFEDVRTIIYKEVYGMIGDETR